MKIKIFTELLVVLMVFNTVFVSAQAFYDVGENDRYYEAVEELNVLQVLGGYPDGSFRPYDTVTRAEMAVLVTRCLGYTTAEQTDSGFTDVPVSHWASGYIAIASGHQIVNGTGDKTFAPDLPVLYEQSVKMVIDMLGYSKMAIDNGGYPVGYITAAYRTGILDNIARVQVGMEMTRGEIAVLLANAIDIPTGEASFLESGTTLRNRFFNA